MGKGPIKAAVAEDSEHCLRLIIHIMYFPKVGLLHDFWGKPRSCPKNQLRLDEALKN
jgi:hypothetical protein